MTKYIYLGVLHIVLIGVAIFAYNKYIDFKDLQKKYDNISSIIKPLEENEIIEVIRDTDSNEVQHSKPTVLVKGGVPVSTQKLLDSITDIIKVPANAKVLSYTKVPISSSITAKATKVTDSLAEYENDNWYLSYNTKDSVFNGRYKAYYNQINYEYRNSLLGIPTSKPITGQGNWLNDKNASIGKASTVIIKEKSKSKLVQLYGTSKFRSMDNSVLTGAEANININRVTISGGYLYNFKYDKPEYEVGIKYSIFKP